MDWGNWRIESEKTSEKKLLKRESKSKTNETEERDSKVETVVLDWSCICIHTIPKVLLDTSSLLTG